MKKPTLQSIQTLCFAPLVVVCLMSTTIAQTTTPMNEPQWEILQGDLGAHDMRANMMSSMERMQNLPMSGDVDKDFAMMMKIHHEHGVEMAKMEIMYGKSSQMKKMAKNIMESQNREIVQFDRWLLKQNE